MTRRVALGSTTMAEKRHSRCEQHSRCDRLKLAVVLAAVLGTSSLFGQAPPRTYPSAKRPLEANAYLPPVPGSTPWAPAWSPDGNWIAVGMSGSIWKVDR